jgi:hypothetical protein
MDLKLVLRLWKATKLSIFSIWSAGGFEATAVIPRLLKLKRRKARCCVLCC